MTNWFHKLVDRILEASWDRAQVRRKTSSFANEEMRASVKSAEIEINSEGRITFDLTPAVGGRILTVMRRPDDNFITNQSGLGLKMDRSPTRTTYVITDCDNLGERVAKIINLELIK